MLVLGIALIVAGVFVDLRRRAMDRALRKYEFEHRSAAGVVGFSDFDAAERHRKRKVLPPILAACAGLLYLAGLALALVGYFGNR